MCARANGLPDFCSSLARGPCRCPQVGLGVALGSFIALIIKWFVTWCK
jgi:Ca2+/Na+ antiporter